MPAKVMEQPEQLTPDQQRIRELEELLAKTREQLSTALRQGEGWLVTTDNPVYDGSVFGVSFVNGAAFIGVDQHVPFFDLTPESDATIKNRYKHLITSDMSEAERKDASQAIKDIVKAQRLREATSSAERAVREFGRMLGYTIEKFDSERVAELQTRMGDRANQRRQAEAALRARANAEVFVPPGYRG